MDILMLEVFDERWRLVVLLTSTYSPPENPSGWHQARPASIHTEANALNLPSRLALVSCYL